IDALKVCAEVRLENSELPGDVFLVSVLRIPAPKAVVLLGKSSADVALPETNRASPVVSTTPLLIPMLVSRFVPPFTKIPDAAVAPVYWTVPGTTVMPPPSKLLASICTAAGDPLLADNGFTTIGLAQVPAAPSKAAPPTKTP